MKQFLLELIKKAEIDKTIVYGLSQKLWLLTTGPVTIFLIVTYFSEELQGFYYTFFSLLAFKIFIELGLGNVTIQFASHEWSKLNIHEGEVSGDTDARDRLISLGKYVFNWFKWGAICYVFSLLVLGHLFFSGNEYRINWQFPWIILSFTCGVEILTVPAMSLLEGCGKLTEVYKIRFVDSLISRTVSWGIIFFGGGLWAIVGYVATNVTILLFFFYRERNFFKIFFESPKNSKIDLKSDIVSMQWRIAVSYISGYVVFSMLNPIAFKYFGAKAAGQLGLSLSLITMSTGMVVVWVNVKVPEFGRLISLKKFDNLDFLFFKTYRVFLILLFGGSCLLVFSVGFIQTFSEGVNFLQRLGERLLNLSHFSLFTLGYVFMYLGYPFSVYLRAHKKEPLLIHSVTSAILMGGACFASGIAGSLFMLSMSYFVVQIIMLPFILKTWNYYRTEWHKELMPG